MHNMTIRKLSGVLALAMVLTAVPLSANAATAEPPTAPNKQVNDDMKGSHINQGADDDQDTTARLGLDPGNVSATGVALDVTGNAIDGSSVDTDIAVWGYTEDGTVYSVDVEWGAMTFQYETSSWDPETHMKKDGAGWVVYDSVNEKKVSDQDAINRITVTNHSNASVYAKLSYAAITDPDDSNNDYSDITGSFTEGVGALMDLDYYSTIHADKNYIELDSADNNGGDSMGVGKPTVGNVYFMPDGITLENHKLEDQSNGIKKWTKIGVITVSLATEKPTDTPDAP